MLKALSIMMLWAIFLTVGQCEEQVEKPAASPSKVVSIPATIRTLVSGFNQGSPKKMGTVVSESCEVRYIDDKGESSLGSRSRQELVKQMTGYFAHVQEPRSQLSQVTIAGRFVTARESVSWRNGDRRLTQYSLVVFELDEKEDCIARVWYYPAQKQKDVREHHRGSSEQLNKM